MQLWQELPEDQLSISVGFLRHLLDPFRPGVREAVELCTKAGVKVRMVTRDNLHTSKAIALEYLASDADATEPTLIKGKRFRELSESEREEVAGKISLVILRCHDRI